MPEYAAFGGLLTPDKGPRARARVPLQPTAGNGSSPTPRKPVRTARDYYDSQEEDHSGKESPFKSPSKGLKLKRSPAKPAQPQRTLKLDAVETLLPNKPKLEDAEFKPSPAKSIVRESPRRRAKVDYAAAAAVASSSEAEDGSDDDFKAGAAGSSDEDDDVFGNVPKISRSSTGRSTLGTSFPKLSPKKKALEAKSPARPVRPSIFDDSDPDEPAIGSPGKHQRKPIATARLSSSSIESIAERGAALKSCLPAPITQPAVNDTPATPDHEKFSRLQLSPTKSRLLSPSKKAAHVPTPPSKQGRPSLDAFWDQGQVSEWNETYSPRKDLKLSPRKIFFHVDLGSSSESEEQEYVPKRSPKKAAEPVNSPVKGASAAAKKAFNSQKEALAKDFFKLLDDDVTEGQISSMAETGGGVDLIWSKKLNSTAGRANWKREAVKRVDKATGTSTVVSYRHIASIELAEKVIDTESRLYNVLAHEYCHLANFMISRVINNPHGASFKEWARKVTKSFGKSHGVEVTTKHDYEIEYKYIWMCMSGDDQNAGCGTEYQRHSKSIDPERHTCGRCKGRLVQIKPKPRKGAGTSGKTETARPGGASGYQKFVKEHFQAIKSDLPPGSPMKDVMKEVGVRYRARKQIDLASPEKSLEVIEVADIADENDSSDLVASAESPIEQSMADVDGIARKLDFMKI